MDLEIELQCCDPDILACVDLGIAHSPVVAFPGEGLGSAVAAHPTQGGESYIVNHPQLRRAVPTEELLVMRCRYILLNSRAMQEQMQPWLDKLRQAPST